MSGRSRRRLWRLVFAGCCVLSTIASAGCGGGALSNMTPAPDGNRSATLRVLQMNLCNSGIAGCYTGRSVSEAAAVIRAERPDIVTLNEVCRDDVSLLARTLSGAGHGRVVTSAFEAAVQQHGRDPVRCRTGQQYGIGLLARVERPDRGHTISAGRYPSQDPADTEQRVWLCVHEIGHFYACTTHLTNTNQAVAIRQCRRLMDTTIPALRGNNLSDPVILGADLNLSAGRSPNAQSCMPPGFTPIDDGGTQDIVVSASRVVSSSSINMHGTTDHPGLLADVEN